MITNLLDRFFHSNNDKFSNMQVLLVSVDVDTDRDWQSEFKAGVVYIDFISLLKRSHH